MERISTTEPRHKLAEATLADTTLATARTLADNQQEGYYWADGLESTMGRWIGLPHQT